MTKCITPITHSGNVSDSGMARRGLREEHNKRAKVKLERLIGNKYCGIASVYLHSVVFGKVKTESDIGKGDGEKQHSYFLILTYFILFSLL